MSDETDPDKPSKVAKGQPEAEPDDLDDLPDSAREVLLAADQGEPAAEAAPAAEPDQQDLLLDEVDLKDALRGALRPPKGAVAPSLLRGVQKKLRVRSRGKFYGDGWSTSSSPRSTYLVTSALMLLLIAVVFFALLPYSSSSVP